MFLIVINASLFAFAINALAAETNSAAREKPNVKLWKQHRSAAQAAFKKQDFAAAEQAHLAAVAEAEKFDVKDSRGPQTFMEAAMFYYDMDRYGEADRLARKALAARESAGDSNRIEVVPYLVMAGEAVTMNHNLEDAEQMFLRAKAIVEKSRSAYSQISGRVLRGLGKVYYMKGEFEKAEPHLKEALGIFENPVGKTVFTPDGDLIQYDGDVNEFAVANTINLLALLYRQQDRLQDAEQLYLRGIKYRERHFGKKHPMLALSLRNMAHFYLEQKKSAEAEPLLKRAFEIEDQAKGLQHPDTILTFQMLAKLYRDGKQFEQAEKLYQHQMAAFEKKLGANHPACAGPLRHMGELYLEQGDTARLNNLYPRILALKDPPVKEEVVAFARLFEQLADQSRAAQQTDAAIAAYERTLSLFLKVVGGDHVSFAPTVQKLMHAKVEKEDFAAAEALAKRQCQMYEKAFGASDSRLAAPQEEHARILRKLGRTAEAETLEANVAKLRSGTTPAATKN
jgi:tetratricopeptide (TPR) repeat protein